MSKNAILHVNNWCILGGIESAVLDFAITFPQFEHILLTVQAGCEDLSFAKHVQNCGLRYMNAGGKVTQAMVEEFDPSIIFLHNTRGDVLEGEWPFAWLRKWRVIGAHHAPTWPLIPADLDWFVSDFVRARYKKCEQRMKAFTMPPCVWEQPYLAARRPIRRPVVGRVQSSTNTGKGKVPSRFFKLLEMVEDCEFFVVTTNGIAKQLAGRKRYTTAPIAPGTMPQYLERVDVFAVWGETPETWSRVVTEANLSGIPVVARDHGDGLAEQIRKSGGGVLVKSEQGFVENVQALVWDARTRQEIGERGRAWCLANASSKVLRERFTETFLKWSLN